MFDTVTTYIIKGTTRKGNFQLPPLRAPAAVQIFNRLAESSQYWRSYPSNTVLIFSKRNSYNLCSIPNQQQNFNTFRIYKNNNNRIQKTETEIQPCDRKLAIKQDLTRWNNNDRWWRIALKPGIERAEVVGDRRWGRRCGGRRGGERRRNWVYVEKDQNDSVGRKCTIGMILIDYNCL